MGEGYVKIFCWEIEDFVLIRFGGGGLRRRLEVWRGISLVMVGVLGGDWCFEGGGSLMQWSGG